jgi:hypothetical protein
VPWRPIFRPIEAHVLAAERLHGDDTTVPVLARGKTDIGRLWVYVRDDTPFAGGAPRAAVFQYSRDRRGEHPRMHLATWSGIFQADAYGGFSEVYADGRTPGPVLEAKSLPFLTKMATTRGDQGLTLGGPKPVPPNPSAQVPRVPEMRAPN